MQQQTLFDQQSALKAAFMEYHNANPEVWQLFKRYTFRVLNAGHSQYSARAIIHRIRWHVDVETETRDGFKVNNNHSPYYARMFMRRFPLYRNFFQLREVKE